MIVYCFVLRLGAFDGVLYCRVRMTHIRCELMYFLTMSRIILKQGLHQPPHGSRGLTLIWVYSPITFWTCFYQISSSKSSVSEDSTVLVIFYQVHLGITFWPCHPLTTFLFERPAAFIRNEMTGPQEFPTPYGLSDSYARSAIAISHSWPRASFQGPPTEIQLLIFRKVVNIHARPEGFRKVK